MIVEYFFGLLDLPEFIRFQQVKQIGDARGTGTHLDGER